MSASRATTHDRDFGKVAVLLGGPSAEREISLLSGNAVLKALRERGVDAHPFDPARAQPARARAARASRASSSRCTAASARTARCRARSRRCGIPYTGSGVMASALAMDKWRTKLVWLASGIPTPRYRVVDAATDWMQRRRGARPAADRQAGARRLDDRHHQGDGRRPRRTARSPTTRRRSTTRSCWSRNSSAASS